MDKSYFPKTAKEIDVLSNELISHLGNKLGNWHGRRHWSKHVFNGLRSFGDFYKKQYGTKLKHYPSTGTVKGAFLWDYLACQDGRGILIAGEIEHDYNTRGLKHDFEKLLYVRSPLKIFVFWTTKLDTVERTITSLEDYMRANCSEYSPGEIFILFRVHWKKGDESGPCEAWTLQVPGDIAYVPVNVKFVRHSTSTH